MNIYRTLSLDYDRAYQAHLEAFKRRLADTFSTQGRYTDFYPSIGARIDEEVDVLVYGQAVGGWNAELNYSKDIPGRRAEESKRYSNEPFPGHSPLDWVNVLWTDSTLKERSPEEQAHYEGREKGYRAWRSFFWQTTIALMQRRHGITDDEAWGWHKGLVWSNLYKIAPQWWEQEDGISKKLSANPSEADRILQRPECIDLVRMELAELRPKACIVLTNDAWWAHFRRGLPTTEVKIERGPTIDSVEDFEGTRIVVVKRGWGVRSDDAVRDILDRL